MINILVRKFAFVVLACLSWQMLSAQELQPTETESVLNVFVSSMKNVPRQGEVIKFVGKKGKKIFSGITNKEGKFSILIPEGDSYEILYKTFADSVEYNTIDVPKAEGKYTFDVDLKYDPPQVYTLKNVLFETGKSILRPESNRALNDLVEILKLKPKMIIEISGHTDNIGSPETNLKLSLERATAVRNYLIQHGIAPTRLTAKGYGDTQAVETNDTDAGRAQNRRTEVRIISE